MTENRDFQGLFLFLCPAEKDDCSIQKQKGKPRFSFAQFDKKRMTNPVF